MDGVASTELVFLGGSLALAVEPSIQYGTREVLEAHFPRLGPWFHLGQNKFPEKHKETNNKQTFSPEWFSAR